MADKDTCPVCDLHSSTLHREGFCPRCWHPEVEHLRSWGFQIRNAILARNTGDLSDTECFMRLVSLANDMPTITRLDSMPDTTPVLTAADQTLAAFAALTDGERADMPDELHTALLELRSAVRALED
jgi:hypothetical protein